MNQQNCLKIIDVLLVRSINTHYFCKLQIDDIQPLFDLLEHYILYYIFLKERTFLEEFNIVLYSENFIGIQFFFQHDVNNNLFIFYFIFTYIFIAYVYIYDTCLRPSHNSTKLYEMVCCIVLNKY